MQENILALFNFVDILGIHNNGNDPENNIIHGSNLVFNMSMGQLGTS